MKCKGMLLMLLLMLFVSGVVQAAGLTVWGLTEQATSVDADNAVTGRIGYFLGVGDGGGLEPFVGSEWRPRDDAPQVIVVGAVQHLQDLIDPNSTIPWLPDLFLTVINEDVTIRPYIGAQCTINLIDQNSGFIGAITGITVMLAPDDKSQLVFELAYDKMFAELSDVPDHELIGSVGVRIQF